MSLFDKISEIIVVEFIDQKYPIFGIIKAHFQASSGIQCFFEAVIDFGNGTKILDDTFGLR